MVKNIDIVFQAYATVASAAEGKDPDSEEYGKVNDLKQYPLFTNKPPKDFALVILCDLMCLDTIDRFLAF